MAISFQCGVCNKPYKARDQMAGKRVRCKQCGAVIDVPVSSESLDPEVDLNTLAGVELSGSGADMEAVGGGGASGSSGSTAAGGPTVAKEVGPDRTRMERPDDAEAFEVGETAAEEIKARRPNKPFTFPYADALDQWAPHVLVWGGMLWMLLRTLDADPPLGQSRGPTWLAWERAAVMMAMFWGIIVPICAYGIGQAAKSLRFALPPKPMWRAAATAAPPFVLGYVLWTVAWEIPSLLSGVVIGLILACFFLWLLFRLDLKEVAMSSVLSVIAFLVAATLTGLLMFGLNWGLQTTLEAYGTARSLPASPLGCAFSWTPPLAEAKPGGTTPAPGPRPTPPQAGGGTEPGPGQPGVSPVAGTSGDPGEGQRPGRPAGPGSAGPSGGGTDAGPVANAPALVMGIDEIGDADDVVRPLAPAGSGGNSTWLAVVRRGPKEDRVERWTATTRPAQPTVQRSGEVSFLHAANARDVYHLSNKGDQVARLVDWPKSVEIWPFDADRSKVILLEPTAKLEMLGFGRNDHILFYAERNGQGSLLQLDPQTQQMSGAIPLPSFLRCPGNLALSPDGRWLAVLRGDEPGGVRVSLYDMERQEWGRDLPIRGVLWEVRARGIAFSPDSAKVAVLMENGGNSLVVWGPVAGTEVSQHIKPGGLFVQEYTMRPGGGSGGSGRSWAGDGLGGAYRTFDFIADGSVWLADGDGIIDVDSGTFLRCVSEGQTKMKGMRMTGQWPVDVDHSLLAFESPEGNKLRVAVVKLQASLAELREQAKKKKDR